MSLVVGGELLPPVRYAVYERDGYTCRDCRKVGQPGYGKDDIQAHHIVPRLDGGTHDLNNLVTLCGHCHIFREMPSRRARFAAERERSRQRQWSFLTVEETAERIGMTRQSVLRYIKEGRLAAERLGRVWAIRRVEVEALVAAGKPKRGRPRKEGTPDDR